MRAVTPDSAWIDRLADDLHTRTQDVARINCVAQIDGVKASARIHIEDCGEASSEINLSIGQRDQRALRFGFSACVDVDVCVDHAGHDGHIREVDHVRARRNGKARADFRNAVASHDHHLIGEHSA